MADIQKLARRKNPLQAPALTAVAAVEDPQRFTFLLPLRGQGEKGVLLIQQLIAHQPAQGLTLQQRGKIDDPALPAGHVVL